MKEKITIRKAVNTSLAFLISTSHVATAMDRPDLQKGVSMMAQRNHDYYKQELRKLEESTVV
jgi:hypothetical protein